VERKQSPENLATLAVLEVVTGNLDEATDALRRALQMRPDDPNLLNDLAATLLARAEATGEVRSALAALESAEHAAVIAPSPEPLFNAALARERLGLRARAIDGWQRYLEEDARSGWAAEASERLDRLEREASEGQIVAELFATPETELEALGRNPWADRQFGERTLFARWAEQWLAGDRAGAEAALAEMEDLAAGLTAGGGRILTASAAAIREAERNGEPERLARLARGHAAYGRAFRLYRAEHADRAHALLGGVIDDLRFGGSPFELPARLLWITSAPEAEWAEIQRVDRAAEENGFPALVAEARREAAYRATLEGRFEPALDLYEDSRRRFLELGEHELATVLAIMRADLFDAIGNELLEMEELARALAAAPAASDAWNRYSIYVVATTATAGGGFPRAAVELWREAAAVCPDLPERPLCAIDSLLGVARLTPDGEVAIEALASAEALLPDVPASDGKDRTEIDLAVARARWLGGDDRSVLEQEQAVALYAEAAQRYQARGLIPSAAGARAERARVLEQLGRSAESAAEYQAALRTFRLWDRAERFRPENAEKRAPRELRAVYERLLDLELAAAGSTPSRAAFLLSEEMRDRLAPRRSATAEPPSGADLERWIAAVPAGTAVVEYALRGEQATAWVLARGRFDQVALAPRAELAQRIRGLAAERDLEAWQHGTGALFEELLAPVLARLPAGIVRVVLIPDADLYGVPFRALWNPVSGRYLDEELALTLAPSVGHALTPRLAPVPSRNPLPVLSAGFGEFAPTLGLRGLPRAGEEAASVRQVYASTANGCSVDTWEGFRRCAPRARMIHLATHAAAEARPDKTWLALPAETVTLDRLWRELPDLPERPVVVLSSCESVAMAGGGEGLGGLARPFLASGAWAVVGTLWKIDDEDAAALFPAFHRAYRHSGDPAQALREARRRLDGWNERPWAWGGVEVMGWRLQG
jgi:CHAT domain-containing protein